MAIRETVTKSRFVDWFQVDNPLRENQFSYEALGFLYEYLSDQEEDVEFDPIAVCCEFTEYEDISEFNRDFQTYYEDERDLERLDYVISIYPIIVRN